MKRLGTVAIATALLHACAAGGGVTTAIEKPAPPTTRSPEELLTALRSTDAEARSAAAWEATGLRSVEGDLAEALLAVREDESVAVRAAATWAIDHLAFDAAHEKAAKSSYEEGPKMTKQTRPDYPKDAFVRRLHGVVTLDVLIEPTGEIRRVAIRKSVPGLDDAAIACVAKWRFKPAMRNGKPVHAVARADVTFKIFEDERLR